MIFGKGNYQKLSEDFIKVGSWVTEKQYLTSYLIKVTTEILKVNVGGNTIVKNLSTFKI